MAIHESKRQSDLEKRLKLLRQQVYGKSSENSKKLRKPVFRLPDLSGTLSHSGSLRTDISYLYHDLTKIGIFASLAIGVQIILFVLIKNHIINLNFF